MSDVTILSMYQSLFNSYNREYASAALVIADLSHSVFATEIADSKYSVIGVS
jgi:hypothetical protein